MPSYFELRTGLSRGQDDGTAKKYVCTWRMEYFHLADTGLLDSVSVFDDGLVYRSPPAPFRVPQGAEPSTAEAYEAVLAKCLAKERAARLQQKREAAFRKLLASGNIYASIEIEPEPEPAAVPAPFLSDFTVIDLEFQGTSILELAAVRYQHWQPIAELVTFVRFTEEVNYHLTKLTGITARDVANAPDEKQVLQWFRGVAGDSILVCHNLSADRRILEAVRTRLGAQQPLPNPWLCTLALAKKRQPGRSHKLGDLCREAGISTQGAHRARNDVRMCAQLLRCFHQEQAVTKGDLYGAPQPSKSCKVSPPAGPGLFAAAA